MTLQPGRRLGPYEVVAALGAGGMGEVYRARDTRLGRDVALKVLPADVAGDPGRRLRFEREARAVAALEHPGVVVIHDVGEADGVAFIVTELLAGETLRSRLRSGPVPWERVAEWGASVAEALAAAHARGIVHRDVKPENLFLTRDGRLKVLDFGLARELPAAGPEDSTLARDTAAGQVLGTAGYLSPEQARGQAVDGRSDVFSLGCVLYEAVTLRPAFGGRTLADHLAAVLKEEPPPVASVRPEVPAGLSRIVERCLAKDRGARFQSASDLAFALREIVSTPSPRASGVAAAGSSWRAAWTAVGAGLLGLAAGYWLRPTPEPFEPVVLQLTAGVSREASPAISPDGTFVAYLASEGGRTDVWVKFVEGGARVNLTAGSGLEIQSQAAIGGLDISPDGKFVSVRAGSPGEASTDWGMWIVPAPLGGPPRRLVGRAGGMRWSPDGESVAYMRPNPALGDAILVARRDGTGERELVPPRPGFHVHEPAWSRDGRWVYFNRGLMPNNEPPTEVWRVPSGGGRAEPVVRTHGVAHSPEPTPDGRALVYVGDQAGGTFNLWWRDLAGGGERRLTRGAGEYLSPRFSRDGRRLACEARTSVGSLRVLDLRPTGAAPDRALTGSGAEDAGPATSRTGRLVFSSVRSGTRDIWTSDLEGGDARPLTSDAEADSLPAVSPDGTRVAFVSDRGGRRGLWVVSVEGGGPRALASVDVVDRPSWSPDGRRIVYAAEGENAPLGLWTVPADGGTPTPVPGVSGRSPVWSPAGDVIAYFTSDPRGMRVRFTSSQGEPLLGNLDVAAGATVSMAFSWDGRSLATGISPGSGDAEIVVIDLEGGRRRTVLRGSPFTTLQGLAWTPDDARLVYGLVQHESRILLFEGLGRSY